MIDKINRERHEHIVSVEDPIEFVHEHKGCPQPARGLRRHERIRAGFSTSRGRTRHRAIGEMRDRDDRSRPCRRRDWPPRLRPCTRTAPQTINRVIDVFPPHQQPQVRAQLSLVLQGVISQQLVPRKDGKGRCLAAEVMIPNPAIRNLIREEKVHQLYSQMQVGQTKFGMQTMSQSLVALVQQNLISIDEAVGHATELDEVRQMLGVSRPQTTTTPTPARAAGR
jgi:twitching motility protein PilT